jgi:serine protease AprX
MEKTKEIPPILYAEVPVQSGGVSIFEKSTIITTENIDGLIPPKEKMISAAHGLSTEGFQIQLISAFSISIAGKSDLFKKVFKEEIVRKEVPVTKGGHKKTTSTFLDCPATDIFGLIPTSKSRLSDVVPDGVALTTPVQYLSSDSVSPIPPSKAYWHLEVPDNVSSAFNASSAHRAGFTGEGIRVCMTDTGFWKHPYFTKRGYRIRPTTLGPATVNSLIDEDGHGTAESANIFAVAPNVDFMMVKQYFGDDETTPFTPNAIGAFNAAVASNPDVISCSWTTRGLPTPLTAAERLLSAAVANAVRQGIIVVFAAGNGHYGFPGEHPDVISAGGVFMRPDGSLEASNYASGFKSHIFPNRNCPDICGLVGLNPRAAYIMLPLPPHCDIDKELAVPPVDRNGVVRPECKGINKYPCIDETLDNDGWAAISGTSAAAPQVAGICALMKQANPSITPVQAKEILKNSAVDVLEGYASVFDPDNPQGPEIPVPAGPGGDLATGNGFVDAFRAVTLALETRGRG